MVFAQLMGVRVAQSVIDLMDNHRALKGLDVQQAQPNTRKTQMKNNNEQVVFSVINSATGKEIDLALQELWVTGQVLPTGAALQVRHVFKSTEPKPVEVVYAFGLPRDAALRRFQIVGQGFSVASELKPTAEATKIYEDGIEAGNLSSLATQHRDGVVNLNVGNIRPGETVAVYLEILAGVEGD